MKNKNGFTLVELLIVVSIVSLLAAIGISGSAGHRAREIAATEVAVVVELDYHALCTGEPYKDLKGHVFSCTINDGEIDVTYFRGASLPREAAKTPLRGQFHARQKLPSA